MRAYLNAIHPTYLILRCFARQSLEGRTPLLQRLRDFARGSQSPAMSSQTIQSSVIGGAMLPHAPQFFTLPETEDRATVERVRTVAKTIGDKLKALKPDLWIIFANDHAAQFFHQVAPAFTVHVGGKAKGHFAGRNSTGAYRVRSAWRSSRHCTARGSTRPSPAR